MTDATIEAIRRGLGSGAPRRAFPGGAAAFDDWRRSSAERLAEIYRLRREPAPGPARVAARAERDGFTEDRLVLPAPDGLELPAYLLVPAGPGPHPTVVFLYGHDASIEQVVGKADAAPDGHEAYRAYMRCLRWVDDAARAGFACLVPELRGCGSLAEGDGTCQHAFLNALAFGGSLQGMRLADLVRWVDYLVARPDLRPDRLAAVGVSLGGELAVLLAALDERVGAVVPAGFVRTILDELHGSAFCACMYQPDLFAEFDLPEIAGLVAPRPLLVQSGDRDPLYPRANAEAGVARLREIYAAAGGRLETSFFPGLHELDGPGAIAWLRRVWG